MPTFFPLDDAEILTNNWDPAHKITATTPMGVILCNPSDDVLYWTLSQDDTLPTQTPPRCASLSKHDRQPITLDAGYRLWVCGHGAYAVIEG